MNTHKCKSNKKHITATEVNNGRFLTKVCHPYD